MASTADEAPGGRAGAGAELPAPGGFAELIGVEIVDAPLGEAHGHLPVGDSHLQPYGIVHGGVYASLAETITSHATWLAVRDEGLVAIAQANQTSFLRAVGGGTLEARGVARQRGRTTWVWDVDVADDEGRVCAVSRLTIAVRPMREPRG